jgi:hypothetical protein
MFKFIYCGCDRTGQLVKSGSLGREGWGESHGYSKIPRWSPPHVSIKDNVILAPMARLDLY